MRRSHLPVLALGALLVLGGCSSGGTPTPTEAGTDTATTSPSATPGGSFETTVDWPAGGVVGDSLVVHVTVTNEGDTAGTYETALQAAGDTHDTASTTVDPGASATLTLELTPGSAGTFDATAGGETRTLTVHGSALEFVDAAMGDVDTHRSERIINETGQIDLGDGPQDFQQDARATVERNFSADTYSARDEVSLVVGDTEAEETHENWAVDGTMYERLAKHTEGVTEYNTWRTPKPALTTVLDIHGTDTEPFLSTAHTDEAYVFVFEPETSADATALMRRVIGEGEVYPAEHATDARLEFRYDRRTGRVRSVSYSVTIDGGDTFPTLERQVTQTTLGYGEPVSVSVPQAVRENATSG